MSRHLAYPPAHELEEMPVLCEGLADDQHIDDGDVRYWLSRCGILDGEPCNNKVTVEALTHEGCWADAICYDGRTLEVVYVNTRDGFRDPTLAAEVERLLAEGWVS